MKIKILVYQNISYKNKIENICKKNKFLKQNINNFSYFNSKNWQKVFEKTVKEIKQQKKYEKLVIFSDFGFLPFYFFTKNLGFTCACPVSIETTNLCRGHNNSNVLIVTKRIVNSQLDKIINAFFEKEFEGGRHATRCQLMQIPYKSTNKRYSFNSKIKKTIVLCSDHAGYDFKERTKSYLIKKGYKIIDAGCFGLESTHYPLFAIAFAKNVNKATTGIVFCYTGVGMANTVNKFKGLNCFVCNYPEQVKIAKEKFNANVMSIASNFISFKDCIKSINQFLKSKSSCPNCVKSIDKYGYDFDKNKFKKIKIEKNIKLPKELK